MLAVYLIAIVCCVAVQAHPDGAPLDSCASMTPLHNGNLPQTGNPPYELTLSNPNPAVGEQITVTISSPTGNTFQGFLIKAMLWGVDEGAAGTFINSDANYHTLACFNLTDSALTHSNPNNKTSVVATWSTDTAAIYNFKASIVEYFDTFWVGLYSDKFTVQ